MISKKLLVLVLWVMVAFSGALQAGKYSLITSVVRNGVALRVKIESPAMDKIAPDMSNYFKEILIDQLASFKNPLEAHVDLSRFYFVSNSITNLHIEFGKVFKEGEPSPQKREEYESMMTRFKEYAPSLSTSWEDRQLMSQKLLAQAVAVSTDVAESLYKDKTFRDAFATEELLRGIELENFFAAKRQEFDNTEVVAVEKALQELEAISVTRAKEITSDIAFLAKLSSKMERVKYAFQHAVHASLLSKLLDGTDEAYPSLMDSDLSHQDNQQATRIEKDIWVAIYRQEAAQN